MAIVLVEPTAQAFLRTLAAGRNGPKANNRKGWGKLSAEDNHYIGLLGEYAASRVLDGYNYSLELFGKKGDGGNGDLRGPHGTINVKTRTKRGYDFALSGDSLDGFKADAAVLCWPGDVATQSLFCNGPEVQPHKISLDVVGIMSYADFALRAHHVDFGYGKRLACSWERFRPIHRPLWGHEVQRYTR